MNLVTLELRKHRLLWLGLGLVALLWASWTVRKVITEEPLLALAAALGMWFALVPVGLLVPIVLARTLSGEATGPLAFLLTGPRRGWAHVAARFGVALVALAAYYGILVGTTAWTAARAGVGFDAWLPWGFLGYGLVAWAAPAVLLGLVYGLVVAAYRPGRGGQIVAVVAVLGALALWTRLVSLATERLGAIPELAFPRLELPANASRFFGLGTAPVDLAEVLGPFLGGVPLTPLLGGILVSVLLFALAARLWEEVEWA